MLHLAHPAWFDRFDALLCFEVYREKVPPHRGRGDSGRRRALHDMTLASVGLRPSQYHILSALVGRHDHALAFSELAGKLRCDRRSLRDLLHLLERDRLVTLEHGIDDRGVSVVVVLTDRGYHRFDCARELLRRAPWRER